MIAIISVFGFGRWQVAGIGRNQGKGEPTVTLGKGQLAAVRLPGWFSRKNARGDGRTIIIGTLRYELRSNPGTSPELIFGMKDIGAGGEWVDGDDFYAVSLDGRFKSRIATRQEWDAAQRLSAIRDDPFSRDTSTSENAVQYHGKQFRKTGKSWESTHALPSPGGRWIVVFSHTSEKDLPSYSVLGGGGRGKGELFIDVYDVKSGTKVLAGHAPHAGGAEPSHLFVNSLWAGERYLIVPIDTPGDDAASLGEWCFLGILPN